MQENPPVSHEKNIPSTVFAKLINPIKDFIEAQEKKLPRHHNQKFGYSDFFMLLIYYFTSGEESIAIFIDTLLNKGLLSPELHLRPVPRSTFNDAFERFSPDLFRDVFQHLLSSLKLREIPELAALGTLYCIDGSLFPVINSMLWAEYTKTHNALKLHLCFELNRMIPVDFLVSDGNGSERKALIKMLSPGVTYIADRGYMAFYLCHEVVQAKAHFVFRTKESLLFSVTETLEVRLPAAVQNLFENVTDALIRYTNDDFGHIYRLVRFDVGGESYCILTDRRDLTTFQVIMLYAYRWQIELLFRFLKRTMNGIHLIRHDERGVTIQFYVLLIAALLELHLKQDVMEIKEEEKENVSFPEKGNEDECGDKKTADSEQGETCDDAPLPSGGRKNRISRGCDFVEMLGKKVKKYWKIGIHWLIALRNMLSKPFDEEAIEILGGT